MGVQGRRLPFEAFSRERMHRHWAHKHDIVWFNQRTKLKNIRYDNFYNSSDNCTLALHISKLCSNTLS